MAVRSTSAAKPIDRLRKAFYSSGEVAGLASVSNATIIDDIEAGRLAAVKLSERTYRIPRKAVIRLLGIEMPEPVLIENPARPVDL